MKINISNHKKINSLEDLIELSKKMQDEVSGKTIISICTGTGCKAFSTDDLYGGLIDELKKFDVEKTKNFIIKKTGCHGYCEKGPIMLIYPNETCYLKVKREDLQEIIEKTLNGQVIERLLFKDESGNIIKKKTEIPFYKFQKKVVMRDITPIDPENIDDYIRIGGYQALINVIKNMKPDEVLEIIKDSNLRGRGGGGFPAGLKWETTKNAEGDIKYVIVNADEGDPGAFMDRGIMEGNPHSVLEGLIIGAYAMDSNQGYIYVRQEYPIALKMIENAIRQATEYGFLGRNIMNSGFDFNVKVHRGAGAFVSGESSALITAIEGRVGEPKLKYVRTAVSGLWGKPTNLNNVETWANVPLIIKNGPQWFKSIGTKNSSGTKIFSLVGKVKNTGLVEVPMGTTLRDIIFKIGGGIKNDRAFKAVQTGGPSGGVIPVELLDLPVDFDELDKAGSMMGSGGMIVMDESDCMVNIAHYYLKFLSEESCGKCVPCREGLRQMLYIYERIMDGKGSEDDLALLGDLSLLMREASLCALGTTAPNIVFTTLKYFREEYEAHIYHNMCPAMVCKNLISYTIDEDKCSGCGSCSNACPSEAITGENKKPHVINQKKCIKCGACLDVCPDRYSAVMKKTGMVEVAVGIEEKSREKAK